MNASARRAQLYWGLAWWLVSAMLVAGMLAPMFTFTKFYFFDDTFSLAAGIFHLLEENEPVLFVIVFAFSMLMPAYKMLLLYRLLPSIGGESSTQHMRMLKHLGIISKWSMLDVFVLAILVVTVKLGAIAQIQIHYGLYLFSLAVIGSMLLTQMIQIYAARNDEKSTR